MFAGAFFTGGAITLTGCLAIAFSGSRALAQNLPIVPDGTLGPERSVVNNNVITGGAQRGVNLFHSFSDFNVGERLRVDFANPTGIENILTRVTGNNPSSILGTLGVLGKANLFLLNPNGIIFGPNAQLNIGGSFVGTTAHAIGFPGDGKFPHHSPIDPNNPLLALNPNALFFNKTPAGVSVKGSTLAVQPGHNLFLVGGNVIVQDGKLTAPGGRIELGGLAEAGEVRIEYVSDSSNPTGNFPNARLLFHDDLDQANVSLTNATIDASKAGRGVGFAGDIFIVGDQISVAQSNIFSNGKVGIISLNGRDQVYIVNSQIKTRGLNGSDDSGLIKIEATEGSVRVDQSTLSTTNPGSGLAGDISISARDQVSIINSSGDKGIFSQGDLGNIFIGESDNYSSFSPRTVTINNSRLQTNGRGSGIAGNIIINAHDQIAVNNSEVASQSNNNRTDDFGVIKLAATEGSVLLDNSVMSTSNLGSGYSGDIRISAADQVSIVNGSSIFSRGNLGNIFIGEPRYNLLTPESVTIDKATLNTTGLGSGIAGNIFIRASDQIVVKNYSQITSQSENDRTDDFGVIKLAATEGSVLLNQSTTSTTNSMAGYAGDIGISARDEVSINNSTISSDGNFGRIVIGEYSSPSFADSFSPKKVAIANSFVTTNNQASQADANQPIPSGIISIDASSTISLLNSELQTFTNRRGDAGGVGLQTDRGTISIDNSLIFSTVEPEGRGDGGIITIDTGSLSVRNGSQLQTLVRGDGEGDAGLISIEADGEVSLTNRGRIFSTVERGATGDAGVILMDVGSLFVESSSDSDNASGLTTSMLGVGNPGYILVEARDNVYLRGNGSGLYSESGPDSTNLGDRKGGILIDARSLFIRDGARVSVNNQGSGEAGSIFVNAGEDIILRDQGVISAIAASGYGGNIFLNSGDFLVLVSGSQVSTQVGAGNGGNVSVDTRYIIAAPFNDNNIDAFADLGTGGTIDITANRLYDISERADAPFSNDIDPTARSGVNGTLTATVLNLDPTQGLSNLPTDFIDPTRLIAETCAPRGGITERQKNQFIVTNRGGLPPDPNAAFPGEAVVTDQGTPNQQNNQPNSPHSTNPASSPPVATASPQPPENQPDNPGSTNSTSATQTATASPQSPENQPDRPGSTNSTSATQTATASPQPPENQPDNPGSTNSTSAMPTAIASPQQPIVEAQGWVYDKNGDIKFTNEAPTVTPTHSQLIPASTCNGLSTQP